MNTGVNVFFKYLLEENMQLRHQLHIAEEKLESRENMERYWAERMAQEMALERELFFQCR